MSTLEGSALERLEALYQRVRAMRTHVAPHASIEINSAPIPTGSIADRRVRTRALAQSRYTPKGRWLVRVCGLAGGGDTPTEALDALEELVDHLARKRAAGAD